MTWTRLRPALALVALLFAWGLVFPARAASCIVGPNNQCYPPYVQVNPTTGQPVLGGTNAPATATGAYATPATVSTSSAPVLGAASGGRAFLDLKNESTSQSIACSFGGSAALNTAGSFTIAPGGDKTWEGSFVPSDQINCITSTGTAPLTIGVH